MKDAITAKIAHQCSDLYADAMKLLQLQTLREMWPRDWINVVAGKQAGFHALAEFYQSAACKVAKNYGEELARLAVSHCVASKITVDLIVIYPIFMARSHLCLNTINRAKLPKEKWGNECCLQVWQELLRGTCEIGSKVSSSKQNYSWFKCSLPYF